MAYNDWSPETTPNKKVPVIQVPDSSSPSKADSPAPKASYTHTRLFGNVKPKPLYDDDGKQINKPANSANLREKFAFNGSNLLENRASKNVSRDVEILHGMFKTFTTQFIKAVFSSKGNNDLKTTKQLLAGIVEKRKQREILKSMEKAKTESKSPQIIPSSSQSHVEISSSPEVSPKRSISTKVVLNKNKTISERYNTKLKQQREIEPVVIIEEPAPKKRRLVKGSKSSGQKDQQVVDLSDEEEEEKGEVILNDDFSDSDVDESALDPQEDIFEEKVLEFFNSAEDRDILDVTGCEMSLAKAVVAARPFDTINHFESKNFETTSKRRKKTDGEMLSTKANLVLRGYAAVENLVQQCKVFSDKIASEINKWGVKVQGVNDELEIVDIDIDDEDDITVGTKRSASKTNYFKEKPGYLSDSIELKNYQQVGLNWLYLLYRNNLSCILADEMGLGKTCQVIAFIAYLKQMKINGPHLIVVPSSTLENWMREFRKFCPMLVVEPYYGSQAEREDIRASLEDKWDEVDVLVTTYNMAAGSKEDHGFLKHAGFNTIVYDEGHMLKNSSTERFNKLMKLKANFRLLLTGTPLQNNLRELMSLLEFILPSIFVSKKEDLKYVFTQKSSTNDSRKGYNPLLSERAISQAKKMMAPFILRRKKDQVLQHLPSKHHKVEVCSMVESQAKLYRQQLEAAAAFREEKKGSSSNVLMSLRKAAIHPLLFRSLYTDDILRKMSKEIMKEEVYMNANEQYIFEDMQVMSDFELTLLCSKFPSISKYQLEEKEFLESGKVIELKKILTSIIESKGKVLLFSMFTQVLDILEIVLSNWSIKFLRLDGGTAVDIRQDIIDKFYEEETIPVFLLSTKAGGFGINLVCANNVIIFDQSFNPHDDKQAEDRAHRVGQERDVNVIRLISKDSIEENMYMVAQNKLELDKSMSGEQIESNAISYIEKMIFEDHKKVSIKKDGAVKEESEPSILEIKDKPTIEDIKEEKKEDPIVQIKEEKITDVIKLLQKSKPKDGIRSVEASTEGTEVIELSSRDTSPEIAVTKEEVTEIL